MRILFACSSGGHLAQLTALEPWWSEHHRHWVTFDTADARAALASEDVTWGHYPTTRNLRNTVRNGMLAWRVLHRYRPEVVVSTGAGIALSFFAMAKLLRIRTVYLEVYDRIDSPTLTGRLCQPITDLFLVQWDDQLASYPKAIVVGPVW